MLTVWMAGMALVTHTMNPLEPKDATLTQWAESAARDALTEFGGKGLTRDLFSITIIELDPATGTMKAGDYRGNDPFYPASVVKAFFMAYGHKLMHEGYKPSDEFKRAMNDMIKDSSNDATHAILDYTTGTTAGPELPAKEFEAWKEKRQAVNKWLAALGYTGVNACQKTWCEGPYGRERLFLGPNYENRNSLTSDATARLFAEIALGKCVSADNSRAMLEILRRKNPADHSDADFQARAFIGKALPKGAELFSKAGYTSTSRHDTAYLRLPKGEHVVLSIYTHNNADKPDIIPFIAGKILARYGYGS